MSEVKAAFETSAADGSFDVTIYAVSPVLGHEIPNQVATELSSQLGHPATLEVLDNEPPAAGMSEIAMVIEVVSNAGGAVAFLALLLNTVKGTTLGEAIGRVLSRGRRSETSGRAYVPISINIGAQGSGMPLRFMFHGKVSQQEFLIRLEKAKELAATIPPEMLSGPGGPAEYSFFWDHENRHWRGQIYDPDSLGVDDDFWLPPDLYADDRTL